MVGRLRVAQGKGRKISTVSDVSLCMFLSVSLSLYVTVRTFLGMDLVLCSIFVVVILFWIFVQDSVWQLITRSSMSLILSKDDSSNFLYFYWLVVVQFVVNLIGCRTKLIDLSYEINFPNILWITLMSLKILLICWMFLSMRAIAVFDNLTHSQNILMITMLNIELCLDKKLFV